LQKAAFAMAILDLCIRKDNIKTDLKEVGWGVTDWIDLVQDRDRWRGACECGNGTSGSKKCGEILTS